jgi:hypothetical protein
MINRRISLAAPAGIACVALAGFLLAIGGSPALARSSPQRWPVGIPAPVVPNCAAQGGGAPLMPASAEYLPGGGYAYSYDIDGVSNEYIVPPAGFSPATASSARLAEYGFPARPAGAAGRAWQQAMASYKAVPPPSLCLTGYRSTGYGTIGATPATSARRAGAPQTAYVSDNSHWSGYVAPWRTNRWVVAFGGWTQASPGRCGCSLPAYEATWVGLGGWSDNALLQAGTQMVQTASGRGTRASIYAWFEYLRDCVRGRPSSGACGPDEISVGAVRAGERIFTRSSYQTSNRTASFYIQAGNSTILVKSLRLSLAYYNGQSAEWIAERPLLLNSSDHGYFGNLANFGSDHWSHAYVEGPSGNNLPVASLTTIDVVMLVSHRRSYVLAEPDDLSGAGFVDRWIRANY